jgi:MFS family permease
MSRDLILVAFSLFTWGLGEGMFFIFQSIYLQEFGADPRTIGAILGMVGIAMTVAHLPAGYLSDKLGQRQVMWLAWIWGALATGVMAAAGSLNFFVAGMVLYGLTTFVAAPLNSYLAAARGKLSIGRALTVTQAMYALGAVIGPLIGGQIAAASSVSAIYGWSFILFCLSTLFILFIRKQAAATTHEKLSFITLLSGKSFLVFLPIIFIFTFSIFLPQPLTPNYLQNQRGLTLAEIGGMGSLGSLGTFVLLLGLGNFNPILGLVVGAIMIFGYSTLLWQGNSLFFFSTAFFLSGAYRLSRAFLLAYTRSIVPSHMTGMAFGAVEMVNGMAVFVAPILAGILYAQQPESVYVVSILLACVTAALVWLVLPGLTKKFPVSSDRIEE